MNHQNTFAEFSNHSNKYIPFVESFVVKLSSLRIRYEYLTPSHLPTHPQPTHTTHARAAPHPPAPATQHSILSCRLSRQTKPHQKRAVPDPAPLAVDEIDGPPARWCRLSAITCWCSGKVELYVRWRHRFITFEIVVVQYRTAQLCNAK